MNDLLTWFDEQTANSREYYNLNERLQKFNIEPIGTTHADPAHFIPELIQNADDQNAKEVYFSFDTINSCIGFGHDGKNFSKQDIKDIVSIGFSKKSKKINKIGKFGTGFKSIYKVTDKPEINCKLEEENNQSEVINFSIENKIIPVRQDNFKYNLNNKFQNFETNFSFKLKNTEILTSENFINFIKNNGSKILLFLPNIRKLTFEIDKQKFLFTRSDKNKGNNLIICTIITDINSKKETLNYYRFSKKINLEGYEGESEIVVAYRFNKSDFLVEKNKCLNVFFSTKEYTGYNFLIHGPFFLDESRNHIDRGKKNNEIISDKFEEFIVETIEILKEEKILNISFFKLLPTTEDNIEYLSNIFTKIREYLNSAEIWPTDLKTYEHKDNVVYGKEKFRKCFSSKNLELMDIPYKWLEHSNNQNEILYIDQGLKEFDRDFVEKIASHKLKDFFTTRSDVQLSQLYLLFLEEKDDYQNVLCQHKEIIKSREGQFFGGYELRFSEKNKFHVGINYVYPSFLDEKKFKGKTNDLKIFFEECGVSYVNQNDIINCEIKTLNLKENVKINVDLNRYTKFLKNCVRQYDSFSSKRKNNLKEKEDNNLKHEISKEEFIKNLDDKAFLIDNNKIVKTTSRLYVDDECCKTRLSGIEKILEKTKVYFPKDNEIKSAVFLKFLREFDIKEELYVARSYFSYFHIDRQKFINLRSRNQTGENAIDEDWDLEHFDEMVANINKSTSSLILKTINDYNEERYCIARYKPRKTDIHIDKLSSTFLRKLQTLKWIPARNGKFENIIHFLKKNKDIDKKFFNNLNPFWKNKLFTQIKKEKKHSLHKFLEELNYSTEDKNIIEEELETDPKLIKRHLDQIISSHKQSENNKVKAGKKHAGPLKNSNKKPVWYSTDRKKINKKLKSKSINKSKGRDPSFSKQIKENYDYHCQICMAKSDFNIGTYGEKEKNRRKLIEAAHIKDASASGPGKLNNLLSLCKNCQDKYSEEPNYIMPQIKKIIEENKNATKTNILGLNGYKYEITNGNEIIRIFFQKEHVNIINKKK